METEAKLPEPWVFYPSQENIMYSRGEFGATVWDVRKIGRIGRWVPCAPRQAQLVAAKTNPQFDDLLAAILWVELEISNSSA